MVNLEIRGLGVVIAPGSKVIIPLGRTTVSLDLDTADLARSKESFSGAGCATGGGREVVSPLG